MEAFVEIVIVILYIVFGIGFLTSFSLSDPLGLVGGPVYISGLIGTFFFHSIFWAVRQLEPGRNDKSALVIWQENTIMEIGYAIIVIVAQGGAIYLLTQIR